MHAFEQVVGLEPKLELHGLYGEQFKIVGGLASKLLLFVVVIIVGDFRLLEVLLETFD